MDYIHCIIVRSTKHHHHALEFSGAGVSDASFHSSSSDLICSICITVIISSNLYALAHRQGSSWHWGMMTHISFISTHDAIDMKAIQAISIRMLTCCGAQIAIKVDDDSGTACTFRPNICHRWQTADDDGHIRKDGNTHSK